MDRLQGLTDELFALSAALQAVHLLCNKQWYMSLMQWFMWCPITAAPAGKMDELYICEWQKVKLLYGCTEHTAHFTALTVAIAAALRHEHVPSKHMMYLPCGY